MQFSSRERERNKISTLGMTPRKQIGIKGKMINVRIYLIRTVDHVTFHTLTLPDLLWIYMLLSL